MVMLLKDSEAAVKSRSNIDVHGAFCTYRGQRFYQITNYHRMSNFFMSVVSAYDHWLFISSNGGLTAGRQHSDRALFPYYTEDKITDMAHCTGPMTLIKEKGQLWQPFQTNALVEDFDNRSLYKSTLGDQLFFSESRNGLTFEYGWSFSDLHGIVRTVTLRNESELPRDISFLDGLQNIIPANITAELQNDNSVLLDAYKSADCYQNNLAAFYMSSRLTDLAEPSESLLANSVWHCIEENRFSAKVCLSENAPKQFAANTNVDTNVRQRGQRGSYFITADITLAPGEEIQWMQVCEVTQDGPSIQQLIKQVSADGLFSQVNEDVRSGSHSLEQYLAKADGIQTSDDELATVHHQANTLFNIMRGGLFTQGYSIMRSDLLAFVSQRQKRLAVHDWWATVPESVSISELRDLLNTCQSTDLRRIANEYLPISFSRRHGDPSRPWNKFSINLKDADGAPIKDYQGNWRDIFQNWEPLALSYPKYLPSMISAFLNATTTDGYNPYRVTRNGIEWETPEPDNDWANIGYWSDHQIIYLSKLLELQVSMNPKWITENHHQAQFSYANVPYRIKLFTQLKDNPYDSIKFDDALNDLINSKVETMGSDGKLLQDSEQKVIHGNLIEKLLTLWLAKLSNFVPDGGIWMNTQRPEWNDANNALAGWGLSVVTVAYLHRHLLFMRKALREVKGTIEISESVFNWFEKIRSLYLHIPNQLDSKKRFGFLEASSNAADVYRAEVYAKGLSNVKASLALSGVVEFLDQVLPVLAATLHNNRRKDGLYHGYNILHLGDLAAEVTHLPLMLEGQVAMLSANVLNPSESLQLLNSLRCSDLYREDQHTYLLYPNKSLAQFIDKNCIESKDLRALNQSKPELLKHRILTESETGLFHFNANFRNAKDLAQRLSDVNIQEPDKLRLLDLFEKTFNHKSFTGRSGSFFGYEGLGSTYWHMVSKLLLAAQENWFVAHTEHSETAIELKKAYYDIRAGIGFNKTPEQYGAFPTDPYSHTPESGIARQPGMTGQVKEELITRLGEFGIRWQDGNVEIIHGLLAEHEFLTEPNSFNYLDVHDKWQSMPLEKGSLAFTLAQVPFVYRAVSGEQLKIQVITADETTFEMANNKLTPFVMKRLIERDGVIKEILVNYPCSNIG
ncbi:hypothetical protein KO489_15810 [Reinekea forsetii]|nr:hypothetical protein [Reinekea forsetii]